MKQELKGMMAIPEPPNKDSSIFKKILFTVPINDILEQWNEQHPDDSLPLVKYNPSFEVKVQGHFVCFWVPNTQFEEFLTEATQAIKERNEN